MIKISQNNTGSSTGVVHLHRPSEIVTLDPLTTLIGNEVAIIEDTNNGNIKMKVLLSSLFGHGTDPDAVHLNGEKEFRDSLDPKNALTETDLIIIEDSDGDIFDKKKITLSAINIDYISDGVLFKKMTDSERTKLSGISDGADVTADAEPLLSVNTHSDITSTGDLIEDAVSLRHAQGTDTTLGIQTANSDWGTKKITNAADPDEPQDYATKSYVDANVGNDINAIHKNLPDEIHSIIQKDSPIITDYILIEDSEDSWNKKRVLFPSTSGKYNLKGWSDIYNTSSGEDSDWPISSIIYANQNIYTYNKIWVGIASIILAVGIKDDGGVKSILLSYALNSSNPTFSDVFLSFPGITIEGNPNVIGDINNKSYIVCDSSELLKKIIVFSGANYAAAVTYDLQLMAVADENPSALFLTPSSQYLLIGTGSPTVYSCKIIRGILDSYTTVYSNGIEGIVVNFCKINSNQILAVIYNELTNTSSLLSSIDDGITWSLYAIHTSFKIDKLCTIGDGVVLCVSDNEIFKSIDNGLTFNMVPLINTGTMIIKDIVYLGYGIIQLVGGEDSVSSDFWISFNEGILWEHFSLSSTMQNPINSNFWQPYYGRIVMAGGNNPANIFVMQF